VTVTKPAATAPSYAGSRPETSIAPTTAAAAASITIPDVTGENAKIAKHKLETLGLTNVSLSSANPKYSMVFVPENWTVVSVEPAPGSTVGPGDDVIVKVTKE
jgi:beta-lactam-binding protein with PASTA domain